MWRAAALLPIVVTWGWRFVSESLRADFRGGGRTSSYQIMSLVALVYSLVFISILSADGPVPNLLAGFPHVISVPLIAGLQAFWIALFLFYGRSRVTTSTVAFHVLADQT